MIHPASCDCRLILRFWDGLTYTLCENCDHYRLGQWFGLVDQLSWAGHVHSLAGFGLQNANEKIPHLPYLIHLCLHNMKQARCFKNSKEKDTFACI